MRALVTTHCYHEETLQTLEFFSCAEDDPPLNLCWACSTTILVFQQISKALMEPVSGDQKVDTIVQL